MAPLSSTITLCAEIIVSAIVLYSIYGGDENNFPRLLLCPALLYVVFNVSYMVSRVGVQTNGQSMTPVGLTLAIVHGTLSLVMFVALILFFALAWINYRKGMNYFN